MPCPTLDRKKILKKNFEFFFLLSNWTINESDPKWNEENPSTIIIELLLKIIFLYLNFKRSAIPPVISAGVIPANINSNKKNK